MAGGRRTTGSGEVAPSATVAGPSRCRASPEESRAFKAGGSSCDRPPEPRPKRRPSRVLSGPVFGVR